jgi:O-antigen/teichoic acid export membrane protein
VTDGSCGIDGISKRNLNPYMLELAALGGLKDGRILLARAVAMSPTTGQVHRQSLFGPLRQLAAELLARDLRELAGSSALVFAIRVAGAVLAYLSILLLVRWMGAFEFGIYAYVWSWTLVLGFLLPLGFNVAILRFVPEYQARGFPGRLAGIVSRSRLIVAASSFAGALAAALAVIALRDTIPDYYFHPALLALACVPILGLVVLYQGLGRALGRVGVAFAPTYVVQPVLLMAGVGALFAIGVVPGATTALAVMLAALSVTLALQSIPLRQTLARLTSAVRPRYHTRYWLALSMPLLVVEGFLVVIDHTDILMLGLLAEPADVATYYAAQRTAGMLGFLQFAVAAMAGPTIAAIHARGDVHELQRFITGAVRLTFWPSAVAAGGLIALGPFLLSLFDATFVAAYPALVVLALGYLLRAATGPVEYLLNMTGHQKACAKVYGVVALGNLAGNLLLIPLFGILGAAIATALATVLANGWLVFEAQRRLGVFCFAFPLGLAQTAAPRPAVKPAARRRGKGKGAS